MQAVGDISIPLSIDAIRVIDDMPMARAAYWVVAARAPIPGWSLEVGGRAVPVLGNMGVVYRSTTPDGRFTQDEIAALFDQVEDDPTLSIETEDLWLPLTWFDPDHEPQRDEVYRVPLDRFHEAYRYRSHEITVTVLLAFRPADPLPQSPGETEAFAAWSRAQIDAARDRYPKNADLALAWEEGT
ncbi:MAG TPA: hypothetical protein VGB52_05460 [Actinomycetota bacterium]